MAHADLRLEPAHLEPREGVDREVLGPVALVHKFHQDGARHVTLRRGVLDHRQEDRLGHGHPPREAEPVPLRGRSQDVGPAPDLRQRDGVSLAPARGALSETRCGVSQDQWPGHDATDVRGEKRLQPPARPDHGPASAVAETGPAPEFGVGHLVPWQATRAVQDRHKVGHRSLGQSFCSFSDQS